MAEQQPAWFFHEDDNEHPGELVRRATLSSWCATEGIIEGLTISANGTPNNTVKVAAGACAVQGDSGSDQGLYYCFNDAQVSLTVANNAGSTRVDLVVAEVLDSEYGDAASGAAAWSIRLVQGTSGAGTPATPDNCLVIGRVSVPNGSPPTVTSGAIANPTPRAYPRHAMNLITQGTIPAAASLVTVGPHTLVTVNTHYPAAPRYVMFNAAIEVGSNVGPFPRMDKYDVEWRRTSGTAVDLPGGTYRRVYATAAYGVLNNPETIHVHSFSGSEVAGDATYIVKITSDIAVPWDANCSTGYFQILAAFD